LRSHVEERPELRGVEEDLAIADLDRQGLEVGSLARSVDAKAVLRLVAGAVRGAEEIAPVRVPELTGIAVIERDGEVPALVLVGAHLATAESEQDALLVKGALAVAEAKALGRDVDDACDPLHGPSDVENGLRRSLEIITESAEVTTGRGPASSCGLRRDKSGFAWWATPAYVVVT